MKGMTVIVKTITRFMAGLVFLFGFYVVIHGHVTPGGGFGGGVIIAGAFVLEVLARGLEEKVSRGKKMLATLEESVGLLLFFLLVVLGLVFGSVFFLNFLAPGKLSHLFSAGIIPLFNLSIGLEVGAALFVIFIALVTFKKEE